MCLKKQLLDDPETSAQGLMSLWKQQKVTFTFGFFTKPLQINSTFSTDSRRSNDQTDILYQCQ